MKVPAAHVFVLPFCACVLCRNNTIEDEGVERMHNALVQSHMKGLFVPYNGITRRGIVKLAETVSLTPSLTSLRVWGNPGLSGSTSDDAACAKMAAVIDRSKTSLPDFVDLDIRAYEVDGIVKLAAIQ
eukprot:m.109583 g.109583  ORF g.109583 m.109583 type:complete len:128 (-) comp13378_c0_seq3:140-523(-)